MASVGQQSDRVRALQALRLASEACTANLSALSSIGSSDSLPSVDPATLRQDWLSLLVLLRQHATKVALSLKPPPTYAAAPSPLKDLTSHVSALASCTTRFSVVEYGTTWKAEVYQITRDVLESLRALVDTFAKDDGDKDTYLTRIGAVYEITDHATGPVGLSTNNMMAVARRWDLQQGTIEDSLNELKEMIEDAKGDAELDDSEPLDDGWDELGMSSSSKMTEVELGRAKSVHVILRLVTLLHKRVSKDLLKSTTSPPPPNSVLDRFPQHSTTILTHLDDLVASLYSPQDPKIVQDATSTLLETLTHLSTDLTIIIDVRQGETLTHGMQTLTRETSAKKPPKDTRKWIEVCIEQIRTACATITNEDG